MTWPCFSAFRARAGHLPSGDMGSTTCWPTGQGNEIAADDLVSGPVVGLCPSRVIEDRGPKKEKGRRDDAQRLFPSAGCSRGGDQTTTRTLEAWAPLGPCVTSNSTFWFSSRLR